MTNILKCTGADEYAQQRQLAAQVIAIGYKALAQRLHPDAGGRHEDMVRLICVHDRLLCACGLRGLPPRTRRRRPKRPSVVVPVRGTEDELRALLSAAAAARRPYDRQVGMFLLEARAHFHPRSGASEAWCKRHFDMTPKEAVHYLALLAEATA